MQRVSFYSIVCLLLGTIISCNSSKLIQKSPKQINDEKIFSQLYEEIDSLHKSKIKLSKKISSQETFQLFRLQSDTVKTTVLLSKILSLYTNDNSTIDRFIISMRNHFTLEQEKMVIKKLTPDKKQFLSHVGFFKLQKFKPYLLKLIDDEFGEGNYNLSDLNKWESTLYHTNYNKYLRYISTLANLEGMNSENEILDAVMNCRSNIISSKKNIPQQLTGFLNIIYNILPFIHSANCIQKTLPIYLQDYNYVDSSTELLFPLPDTYYSSFILPRLKSSANPNNGKKRSLVDIIKSTAPSERFFVTDR